MRRARPCPDHGHDRLLIGDQLRVDDEGVLAQGRAHRLAVLGVCLHADTFRCDLGQLRRVDRLRGHPGGGQGAHHQRGAAADDVDRGHPVERDRGGGGTGDRLQGLLGRSRAAMPLLQLVAVVAQILQAALAQARSEARESAADGGDAQQHRRMRGPVGVVVRPRPRPVDPRVLRLQLRGLLLCFLLRLPPALLLRVALPEPLLALLELRCGAVLLQGLRLEVVQHQAVGALHVGADAGLQQGLVHVQPRRPLEGGLQRLHRWQRARREGRLADLDAGAPGTGEVHVRAVPGLLLGAVPDEAREEGPRSALLHVLVPAAAEPHLLEVQVEGAARLVAREHLRHRVLDRKGRDELVRVEGEDPHVLPRLVRPFDAVVGVDAPDALVDTARLLVRRGRQERHRLRREALEHVAALVGQPAVVGVDAREAEARMILDKLGGVPRVANLRADDGHRQRLVLSVLGRHGVCGARELHRRVDHTGGQGGELRRRRRGPGEQLGHLDQPVGLEAVDHIHLGKGRLGAQRHVAHVRVVGIEGRGELGQPRRVVLQVGGLHEGFLGPAAEDEVPREARQEGERVRQRRLQLLRQGRALVRDRLPAEQVVLHAPGRGPVGRVAHAEQDGGAREGLVQLVEEVEDREVGHGGEPLADDELLEAREHAAQLVGGADVGDVLHAVVGRQLACEGAKALHRDASVEGHVAEAAARGVGSRVLGHAHHVVVPRLEAEGAQRVLHPGGRRGALPRRDHLEHVVGGHRHGVPHRLLRSLLLGPVLGGAHDRT